MCIQWTLSKSLRRLSMIVVNDVAWRCTPSTLATSFLKSARLGWSIDNNGRWR
jgi:hypothetical protein